MRKRNMIIIGLLLILLLVLLFPKLFWAVHNANTRKLQGHLIPGVNDLEMRYGEDEHAPVKQRKLKTAEGIVYTCFFPAELSDRETRWPVVVWGNGTGNTYLNYEASLRSLASYGFVAAGCDDSSMGDGRSLLDIAVYMKSLDEDPDSMFYRKLDTAHIGAAGHSQGACGAVNAVTKYEESSLFTSLFTTSLPKPSMCVDKKNMPFAYWRYDMSKIRIPYFATTGTLFLDSRWISPQESMKENFELLPEGTEAYGACRIGANHNVVNEYHGCGYFNAWFCYTLKSDPEAAKIFTEEGELQRNSGRWRDVIRQ